METHLVAEGKTGKAATWVGAVFNLDPEVVADASGRNLPQPDEGQTAEFTIVSASEITTLWRYLQIGLCLLLLLLLLLL